jgi:hypothetical protein
MVEDSAKRMPALKIRASPEQTSGYLRPVQFPERRLNPLLWAIVAVLTAAFVTVAVDAIIPAERSSPLLIALPFLTIITLAMILFLRFDQHFRGQSMRKASKAEAERIDELLKGLDNSVNMATQKSRSPSK